MLVDEGAPLGLNTEVRRFKDLKVVGETSNGVNIVIERLRRNLFEQFFFFFN